jgi:DNA-binding CsgD family transcriptional regulator
LLNKLEPLFTLIDHINCDQLTTICQTKIKAAIFTTFKNLGFDYVAMCRQISSETFSFLVTNYPERWQKEYRDRRFSSFDPIMRCGILENTNYGSWSDLYHAAVTDPIGSTDAEKKHYQTNINNLYKMAASHKLVEGGFYHLKDDQSVFTITFGALGTSEHIDFNDELWTTVKTATVIIDQLLAETRGCSNCFNDITSSNGDTVSLTEMQIKIMSIYLKSCDNSLESVSKQLFVTPAAIRFHLKKLRDIFDLPNANGHALALFLRNNRLM